MGLDDRDYMRERRRREARLGSASWIDAKGRMEHDGLWFDAKHSGHGHRRGQFGESARLRSHPLQGWIWGLSLLLTAIPMYGAAKRHGWLPDTETGQAFPESGSVTVARALPRWRVTSWLEVQASSANAVVQLYDLDTRDHVMSVYVAGGDHVRVPAPQGTFQVRLVEGRKWHGATRYFGPNTSYETVVQPLRFERQGTQEIDLRRRPEGNLPTRMMITTPEGI